MEFDYILIGAGSAGCLLADRLSETGRNKVLVLEAGGSDAKFWIKVPLGYGMTFSNPKLNWNYHAAPDPGLNGRSVYWPRGRVVGGSSSINAMAYVRGLAHDFDDWDRAGATGWGWDTVCETYDRLEQHGAEKTGKAALAVADMSSQMHPFSNRFLAAARDMNWPALADLNGPEDEGISAYRSTVRDGFRCSSADAFLRPALRRGNVKLVTHAVVEGVVIEKGRATGVRYRVGEQQYVARALGEVILSAGALNSPQLLQISGIGPEALLKLHGVEVVQDLPQVGEGLQDHLAVTQHFEACVPTLNSRLGHPLGRVLAGLQYVLTRRGPLGVPVNQIGGFVRSDPKLNAPDLQMYCNPASYSTPPDGTPVIDRDPGFILSAQPCRPTSRGQVRITSSHPLDPPSIQPNSLATHEDQEAAVRAGKVLRALASTPTLRAVIKAAKAPDITQMDDAGMLENFRARASTVFHASCTCRMGAEPSHSVLDARLRVHGIRGLRVVDASAFPNVTSGNTNAPVMMLAMRAADLILEDGAR